MRCWLPFAEQVPTKTCFKGASSLKGPQLSRYFTGNPARKKNNKKLVGEVGLQESGSENYVLLYFRALRHS